MRVGLAAIEVSEGSTIDVPSSGLLVIVGPNNAGKSALLRETWQHLTEGFPAGGPGTPLVVPRLRVVKEAESHEELQEWFEQHSYVQVSEVTQQKTYRRAGQSAVWEMLEAQFFDARDSVLGATLTPFVALYAAAEGRLGLLGGGTGLWDPMSDVPSNPFQILYADPALERRLSDICYEAFRVPLTLSRIPGSTINLHMGVTEFEPALNPDPRYMEAIREMPLLAGQGDGMRSFMGLMLATVTAAYPLILLDEPEAFLHPPQVRLLGRKLAEEAVGKAQVVTATHDADFLSGMLDIPEVEVAVVRLTRRESINKVSFLAPQQLRDMWADPILRYSNILDALFHRGAIVSESDADSRYYGAVLDASRAREGLPAHDLLLTQCGSKNRFAVVVRALKAVDVPAVVVADFDVLREEGDIRRIVEAFGEQWDRFRDDWRVVDAQVRTRERNVSTGYVREEVTRVLDAAGNNLTRGESEQIRAVTKVEDGWALPKQRGVAGVPLGEATSRCNRLLEGLRSIGIFVVPVGELESWHPEVGNHGPAWVVDVLVQGLHNREDTPSRNFVSDIAEYLDAKAVI
jgi:hypothetical protein